MAGTYKSIQGDTWDMIAKKVYGTERHMDFLMEHNFPLLDYFVFPTGIIISIPELPEEETVELPAWRKGGIM